MLELKSIKPANHTFYLGLVLFFIFVIQETFALKMAWLEALQQQELFKIYSGLLLLVYLLAQFVKSYNRLCETPHVKLASSYRQHQQRGALAPLFFFIHSTTWGIAYLSFLSLLYFANFLVGLLNYSLIKNAVKRRQFFKIWLPLHILLACVLITFVGFHLYVVMGY